VTVDLDAMADRCYDRGRSDAIAACLEIISKEADLLLFTGARLKGFAAARVPFYTEAELHDQAGTAIRCVEDKIRALQPS